MVDTNVYEKTKGINDYIDELLAPIQQCYPIWKDNALQEFVDEEDNASDGDTQIKRTYKGQGYRDKKKKFIKHGIGISTITTITKIPGRNNDVKTEEISGIWIEDNICTEHLKNVRLIFGENWNDVVSDSITAVSDFIKEVSSKHTVSKALEGVGNFFKKITGSVDVIEVKIDSPRKKADRATNWASVLNAANSNPAMYSKILNLIIRQKIIMSMFPYLSQFKVSRADLKALVNPSYNISSIIKNALNPLHGIAQLEKREHLKDKTPRQIFESVQSNQEEIDEQLYISFDKDEGISTSELSQFDESIILRYFASLEMYEIFKKLAEKSIITINDFTNTKSLHRIRRHLYNFKGIARNTISAFDIKQNSSDDTSKDTVKIVKTSEGEHIIQPIPVEVEATIADDSPFEDVDIESESIFKDTGIEFESDVIADLIDEQQPVVMAQPIHMDQELSPNESGMKSEVDVVKTRIASHFETYIGSHTSVVRENYLMEFLNIDMFKNAILEAENEALNTEEQTYDKESGPETLLDQIMKRFTPTSFRFFCHNTKEFIYTITYLNELKIAISLFTKELAFCYYDKKNQNVFDIVKTGLNAGYILYLRSSFNFISTMTRYETSFIRSELCRLGGNLLIGYNKHAVEEMMRKNNITRENSASETEYKNRKQECQLKYVLRSLYSIITNEIFANIVCKNQYIRRCFDFFHTWNKRITGNPISNAMLKAVSQYDSIAFLNAQIGDQESLFKTILEWNPNLSAQADELTKDTGSYLKHMAFNIANGTMSNSIEYVFSLANLQFDTMLRVYNYSDAIVKTYYLRDTKCSAFVLPYPCKYINFLINTLYFSGIVELYKQSLQDFITDDSYISKSSCKFMISTVKMVTTTSVSSIVFKTPSIPLNLTILQKIENAAMSLPKNVITGVGLTVLKTSRNALMNYALYEMGNKFPETKKIVEHGKELANIITVSANLIQGNVLPLVCDCLMWTLNNQAQFKRFFNRDLKSKLDKVGKSHIPRNSNILYEMRWFDFLIVDKNVNLSQFTEFEKFHKKLGVETLNISEMFDHASKFILNFFNMTPTEETEDKLKYMISKFNSMTNINVGTIVLVNTKNGIRTGIIYRKKDNWLMRHDNKIKDYVDLIKTSSKNKDVDFIKYVLHMNGFDVVRTLLDLKNEAIANELKEKYNKRPPTHESLVEETNTFDDKYKCSLLIDDASYGIKSSYFNNLWSIMKEKTEKVNGQTIRQFPDGFDTLASDIKITIIAGIISNPLNSDIKTLLTKGIKRLNDSIQHAIKNNKDAQKDYFDILSKNPGHIQDMGYLNKAVCRDIAYLLNYIHFIKTLDKKANAHEMLTKLKKITSIIGYSEEEIEVEFNTLRKTKSGSPINMSDIETIIKNFLVNKYLSIRFDVKIDYYANLVLSENNDLGVFTKNHPEYLLKINRGKNYEIDKKLRLTRKVYGGAKNRIKKIKRTKRHKFREP
jgi:hypothetical protein